MAAEALLTGVRDSIIQRLGIPTQMCQVKFQGQPPANAGQEFIGIALSAFGQGPTNDTQEQGIDLLYSVNVVLTQRLKNIPPDQLEEEGYLKAIGGMSNRINQILYAVTACPWDPDGHITLTNSHPNILGKSEVFIEPLRLTLSDPEPTPVGPEWFHATGEETQYGFRNVITFGGARIVHRHTGILLEPEPS